MVVHGGAGAYPRSLRQELERLSPADRAARFAESDIAGTLRAAVGAGTRILASGGAAWDAVEAAVIVLEDSGHFNAGAGATPQLDGIARRDAAIMDGRDARFGAVVGVPGVQNPISLARRIAENTPHVCFAGEGARRLAEHFGLPLADPPVREAKSPPPPELVALYHEMYGDTVGAVALDAAGGVAAATSTGGIHHMLPGRVGDTPFVGCGAYADNALAAISTTGQGEFIIRSMLAARTCWSIKAGLALEAAAQEALEVMAGLGGRGGLIGITPRGEIAIVHSSESLVSASQHNGEAPRVYLTGTLVAAEASAAGERGAHELEQASGRQAERQ